MASSTVFGTRIPYLYVLSQCLWVFEMMRSRFHNTDLTHHAKAGSSDSMFSTVYSASWTGYESFISFIFFHVVLPSFHLSFTSQPFVVITRSCVPIDVVTNASCCSTCVPSVLTYTIFVKKYWTVALFINLGGEILSNEIRCQFRRMAVLLLNLMHSGIENWIVWCYSD